MEIQVEKYLSEDEIKEIIKEEIRYKIQSVIRKDDDLDRILANTYYETVWMMVEETLEEDKALKDLIRKNTLKIINELSRYSVFREKDCYNKESLGQTLLNQAVTDSKDLINNRVAEIITDLDKEDLKCRLEDLMYQVVEDRLIGKSR
jgi:hypothetical protein